MIAPANVRYLAANSSHAITKLGRIIPWQQNVYFLIYWCKHIGHTVHKSGITDGQQGVALTVAQHNIRNRHAMGNETFVMLPTPRPRKNCQVLRYCTWTRWKLTVVARCFSVAYILFVEAMLCRGQYAVCILLRYRDFLRHYNILSWYTSYFDVKRTFWSFYFISLNLVFLVWVCLCAVLYNSVLPSGV